MEQETVATPTTHQYADTVDGNAEASRRTLHLGRLSTPGLRRLSISALAEYPRRRASLAVSRITGCARRTADRPWMRPAWVPVLLVPRQATFALSTISRSRLSCALRFRQLM
jgi:hypothetical protein